MINRNIKHQIYTQNENEITKKIVKMTDDSVWNAVYDLTVINQLAIDIDLQLALDIDSLRQ